jgi:predicted Zn finger-like uncharacterized protein
MAIATNCPSCDAKFKLADEFEGKTVKCKRCQTSFVVPAADGIATKPAAKASSRSDRDDEDDNDRDERPSGKSRRDDDDDDRDDRPSRRSRRGRDDDDDDDRDDDDEDERRPKRREKIGRKKKKKKSSALAMTLICVGVGVLLLVVCGTGGTIGIIKFVKPGGGPGGAMAGAVVTPIVFGADNTFRHENRLTRFDAKKDQRRYRAYSINMEAGKQYQIDMISNHLDSYLFILDDKGQVVAEDDDSGGALNSQIFFRCDRTGEYRIETTSFDPGETGTFVLVARRLN